jgi:hypothetical protein
MAIGKRLVARFALPVLVLGQLSLMVVAGAAVGQTIRVDITPGHETNTIVPTKALGAGIDRLPYGAADKLLTDATI